MGAKLQDMSTRGLQRYPMDQPMPITPQISAGAAFDLGLGDASETEEERKKRLKEIERNTLGSPSVAAIFGPGGGQ